jgi:competence protein ComGF
MHFLKSFPLLDLIIVISKLLVILIDLPVNIRPFELESLSESRNWCLFIMVKMLELFNKTLLLLL